MLYFGDMRSSSFQRDRTLRCMKYFLLEELVYNDCKKRYMQGIDSYLSRYHHHHHY